MTNLVVIDYTDIFAFDCKEGTLIVYDGQSFQTSDFLGFMRKNVSNVFETMDGKYYINEKIIYGITKPRSMDVIKIENIVFQIDNTEDETFLSFAQPQENIKQPVQQFSTLNVEDNISNYAKKSSDSMKNVLKNKTVKTKSGENINDESKKLLKVIEDLIAGNIKNKSSNYKGKSDDKQDKMTIDLGNFQERMNDENNNIKLVLEDGNPQELFENLALLEKDEPTINMKLLNEILYFCEEKGLTLSVGARKRLSKEYSFDSLELLVKIHNDWIDFNNGIVNLIPNGANAIEKVITQTSVEKKIYAIIESSVFDGIKYTTGRMDLVMDGMSNMHACVICLFFTHFNANTLATLGAWAKGIEIMFQTIEHGKVHITLYNLCRNVNAETIRYLMGAASVMSYILTELSDSKFTTGKRAIKWSKDGVVPTNVSTFITNATKNFKGDHALDTSKRVSEKLTKDLSCMNQMTQKQFDKIIRRIDYLKTGVITKSW